MRRTVLPNTLAICEINPHETRFLYNEIFVQKTYMKHGVEISPGDTIIDAGANIGLFALFALVNFNPARVFCFEPATHCLEALRFNLAAWGNRAVVVGSALADFHGEANFTYYPGYSIMSGLFADEARDLDVLKAGARTQMARVSKVPVDDRRIELLVGSKLENPLSYKCPVTTISSVIEQYEIENIDLLKIDVERAENAIIRGIDDKHWERIRQIVVEVHDQGGREHETMRDQLARRGYETVLDIEDGLENSAIYSLTARRG